MPSIFIWKATEPNTSKKTIKYYSGSNWALEDNEITSKSYMFLEQIVIPGFNDSVITYRAKIMPQDWVGSELLEVSQIPYELIKSDNYGTLDRVGNWMRFILKQENEFSRENLENEIKNIQGWMTEKKNNFQQKKTFSEKPSPRINHTTQNAQLNFQEFLIKYSLDSIQNSPTVSTSKQENNRIKKPYSKQKFVKNTGNSYLNKNKHAVKAH